MPTKALTMRITLPQDATHPPPVIVGGVDLDNDDNIDETAEQKTLQPKPERKWEATWNVPEPFDGRYFVAQLTVGAGTVWRGEIVDPEGVVLVRNPSDATAANKTAGPVGIWIGTLP